MSIHVMSWVMQHSEARLGDRLVLLVLADKANDDGTGAWPSVETIASHARMSRRAVQECLRSLEASGAIARRGKHRSGAHVYDVIMGGADFAPAQNPSEGGADFAPLGAQNPASGGAESAPEPSIEQPSLQPSLEPSKAVAVQAVSWRVDRRPVTAAEDEMARAVLAAWNAATGQQLASREWLAKIVMRIREHPEIGLHDHRELIAANLADPWWKGAPTPSVVYGNGAQFERAMLAGQRQRGGDSAFAVALDEIRRMEATR